jgi:hypothetical protein
MKRIKSSGTRRKKANTTPIEKVDFDDEAISEGSGDSEVVVSEILIFEILILAILWVVFLVADSADDREEKALKAEKTSKLP